MVWWRVGVIIEDHRPPWMPHFWRLAYFMVTTKVQLCSTLIFSEIPNGKKYDREHAGIRSVSVRQDTEAEHEVAQSLCPRWTIIFVGYGLFGEERKILEVVCPFRTYNIMGI